MAIDESVPDGTTGRSVEGGRRTHIIRLLRDAPHPLSVADVADRVGIHINTARFHLESLVDAGLAERHSEPRSTRGRPRILYTGTLPNQTHERAQGYRLLSEILTTAIATREPAAADWMYEAGVTWGRHLTRWSSDEPDESQIAARLVDKLDALWFAPEIEPGNESRPEALVLHNCPFLETARSNPHVVCRLHAGMINGSLAEMGSRRRLVLLEPQTGPHTCRGTLGPAAGRDEHEPVVLRLPDAPPA